MNLQINARSYKASYFKTTICIATPKSCVSQAKIFAGICTSQSKLIEWALLCWFTHLNLSCPAVSQICNFTDFPPTFTTLEPNSTPMVWLESCLTTQKIINVKVNVVPLCEMTKMMKNEVAGAENYASISLIVPFWHSSTRDRSWRLMIKQWHLHFPSINWCKIHDFPVPALPITRNLKRKSKEINKIILLNTMVVQST